MKYKPETLFTIAITIAFLALGYKYWEVGLAVLALSVFYFVYWSVNHDLSKYRLQAFIYFFLLMVYTLCIFTAVYEMEGIICSGEIVKRTYESFYFSIVTWTTLGYGDCLPTEGIRHIAALEALFGYIMMAIFISLLMALFTSKLNTKSKHT